MELTLALRFSAFDDLAGDTVPHQHVTHTPRGAAIIQLGLRFPLETVRSLYPEAGQPKRLPMPTRYDFFEFVQEHCAQGRLVSRLGRPAGRRLPYRRHDSLCVRKSCRVRRHAARIMRVSLDCLGSCVND